MELSCALGGDRSTYWGRPAAREKRLAVEALLESARAGDVVVLDAEGLEAFDSSFASEFFCRLARDVPSTYAGRFLVIEHLGQLARENLEDALTIAALAMIERTEGGRLQLIGKLHPVDHETFAAVAAAEEPVASSELKDKLGVASVPAMNERLGKLVSLGLVRRARSTSPAGREQFVYSVPA